MFCKKTEKKKQSCINIVRLLPEESEISSGNKKNEKLFFINIIYDEISKEKWKRSFFRLIQ